MDTRTSETREERIRGRAYAIWRKAGEPIGQDKEHWAKACEEIDEEDGQAEVHSEPIASRGRRKDAGNGQLGAGAR
jgi:hypothetical protein